MPTKKFDIHNPTPAPRVVYDSNHVPVTILPGQTQPNVELEDKVADEHKKRQGDLRLTAPSGRTKAFLRDVPPAEEDQSDGSSGDDEGDDGDDGGEGEGQISESKKAANGLIDQADEMDFSVWKMKAKDLLGKDWPGGKPRKKDLLKLLKKVK